MSDEREGHGSEFSRRMADLTDEQVDAILAEEERKRAAADAELPIYRWEEMADYTPGTSVLARNAVRQIHGVQRDGRWYEIVDGEEYPVEGFVPVEWCHPPGGAQAWG